MIADTVLMIKPSYFGFNEDTAESNSFQERMDGTQSEIRQMAMTEFEAYVELLESNGLNVSVYDDILTPYTPDAVFPNNWFSTDPHTRTIFAYPMKNKIRSGERREDILKDLSIKNSYQINSDLVKYEKDDLALEGTGSMVLDHQNKIVYAALSPRTDLKILQEWCRLTHFELLAFHAYGPAEKLIYHTNVMMTMAEEFAVVAMDSIRSVDERQSLIKSLKDTGKFLIDINLDQMNQFAGNMLQLQNSSGQKFLVMSASAQKSLSAEQRTLITDKFENLILAPDITTIETIGGGSARCMIAEIFV